MPRVELNDDALRGVSGGNFSFNHNNGKIAIGNEVSAVVYQIDSSVVSYSTAQAAFDTIMNGAGSDDDKNAAIIKKIKQEGWGTQIL